MSVIIFVVHAAVWTTVGSGLYLLWMSGQETSPFASAARAYDLSRVMGALRDLWLIIGIALIILLVLATLIPLLETNAGVSTSCVTPSPQDSSVDPATDSTAMICAAAPQPTPTEDPHAGPDYSFFEIAPG